MQQQRFRRTKKWKVKQTRKVIKKLEELIDDVYGIPHTVQVFIDNAKLNLFPIESLSFQGPTLDWLANEDNLDRWSYMLGQEYEKAYLFNHRAQVLKGEISEEQVLKEFTSMKEYYLYINEKLNGTVQPMQ